MAINEQKEVTIKDVIQSTLDELKGISIPASIGSTALMNLSVPIARAMSNLEICLQAIEEEAQKHQRAENDLTETPQAPENESPDLEDSDK